MTIDEDPALVDFDQSEEDLNKGRFPCTGSAANPNFLTAFDFEGHIFQDEVLIELVVPHRDIVKLDRPRPRPLLLDGLGILLQL